MAPDALANCLSAIQGVAPKGPIAFDREAAGRKKDPVLPAPLLDYVAGGVDAINWRPVGLGVRQAILPTAKDASVRLLYIPAGAEVPDHGHHGTELTLVLQGAFRDEFDRFGPGDIEIADPNVEHTPVAEDGRACICLAATDAPLKFRQFLPKIAQPFLRI
jgi:putative transcriptional regulator